MIDSASEKVFLILASRARTLALGSWNVIIKISRFTLVWFILRSQPKCRLQVTNKNFTFRWSVPFQYWQLKYNCFCFVPSASCNFCHLLKHAHSSKNSHKKKRKESIIRLWPETSMTKHQGYISILENQVYLFPYLKVDSYLALVYPDVTATGILVF